MTACRALAAGCALGALLLNFAIEHILTAARGPLILVPGFLDYVRTWNHGVSFSLFSQNSDKGRFVLIAILVAVSVFVGVLAWQSVNRWQAAGYGLVVGGALGNLADRVLGSGAVFDYLFLHLGRLPLFVFNFSDLAISAGVLLLVADTLMSSRKIVPDS